MRSAAALLDRASLPAGERPPRDRFNRSRPAAPGDPAPPAGRDPATGTSLGPAGGGGSPAAGLSSAGLSSAGPGTPPPGTAPLDLAALRRRLAALAQPAAGQGALPFGIALLDDALPGGGLPLVGLHRLAGASPDWDAAAAAGFALALARRLLEATPARSAPLAWIGPALPYAPGLLALGLDPARLLAVRAAGEADLLWSLEEVARSGQTQVVVAQLRGLDRIAGRRLQLAAERGGTALLVLESRPLGEPVPALTCWRVAAAPAGPAVGPLFPPPPAWQVELLRARGGHPAAATLEWDHATAAFALAAGLRLRAPAARDGEAGADDRPQRRIG
jgi:protein ImuA